jgi:hypothetical protein
MRRKATCTIDWAFTRNPLRECALHRDFDRFEAVSKWLREDPRMRKQCASVMCRDGHKSANNWNTPAGLRVESAWRVNVHDLHAAEGGGAKAKYSMTLDYLSHAKFGEAEAVEQEIAGGADFGPQHRIAKIGWINRSRP